MRTENLYPGGGMAKLCSILQERYDMSHEEGRVEGREEGIKIGRTEGRDECRTEITLSMLKLNQPVEFISTVVNLPVEKIIAIGKAHALL